MTKHQYDERPIGLDALHDVETQTTATSGGKKGTKITQVAALDPVAIMEVARVAGYGAEKYAAFNYLQGFEYSKAYNALQRHLNLFWAGEDIDPESGRLHLGHAAIEAMFLISFYLRGIGTDDRPPRLDGDPARLDQITAPRLDLGFTVTDPEEWKAVWEEVPPPVISVMPPTEAPRERCQHLEDDATACLRLREDLIHLPESQCPNRGASSCRRHHAFVRPT